MDNEMMILDKKVKDSYKFNEDNYAAPKEITVTITLNEYRRLVANDATREEAIKKAESDKYDRNREIEALTKENADLKAELYEAKKLIDEYKGAKEDEV